MPFQMRTLSVPPISKLGKLAIVSMVIEAIVIIILEAYVANSFLKSDQSDSNKGIPVYLLLFVTAQLFANGLVVDFVGLSLSLVPAMGKLMASDRYGTRM